MPQILWDWNGTILDDAEISRTILNGMLIRRGLQPVSAGRYREIFTFPIEAYYRAAGFDLSKEPYAQIAQEYIDAYPAAALHARLTEGAAEAVKHFAELGIRQTILSACEINALREQVASFGLTGYFDGIFGAGDGFGGGKIEVARTWLAEAGTPAADAVFVGDTLHDLETAHAIGCRPVLFSGGHQSRSRLAASGEIVIDSLEALYPIVSEMMKPKRRFEYAE